MQLILDKRGIHLSVEDGLFKVKVQDQLQHIPVSKLKSIVMHKSASLTTDAVLLAIENEIEILFFNKIGQSQGRIWSHKYGSVSAIRKNQIQFSQNKKGASWVLQNISKKIKNQSALLLTLGKPDGSTHQMIENAIEKLQKPIQKLAQLKFENIKEIADKVRGYEGSASRVYWECINHHLPPQYSFDKRSQHPALDMFNAMLNYAYGILYSRIESALIQAGIDPYIGIMHRDEYNRPVFVYDFIEPYRIWADYVVLNLCMQQIIFIEFFDIENNVFYLNAQGKRILIQSFNDYFEDPIKLSGVYKSRNGHLLLHAQKLATQLKKQ
jgi:CRISPR-associated protein Cas1